MKSLPERIADALIWAGLANRPESKIKVEAESKRLQLGQMTRVTGAREYDGDKEFIDSMQMEPLLFDFNKDTDPWGHQYEILSASLFEVSPDGLAYRINRYTDKSKMLEAIDRSKYKEQDVESKLQPSWKLKEVSQFVRENNLTEIAEKIRKRVDALIEEGITDPEEIKSHLREDGFSLGGSGGGYAGFSQDWYTGSSPGGQYGSGVDPYAEYVPLLAGPWNKQLYFQAHLQQHALAFEAQNHNPLAKQIIALTVSFCLSRGVDYVCTNIEVDEIIKENFERTDFLERLEVIANDAFWSGNLMVELFDDAPEHGLTDFREIDPSTIWEIVTAPEDVRDVMYAHQQFPSQYQNLYTMPADSEKWRNTPIMQYIIRQIPAHNFLHMKRNVSAWEKFGRSDIFPILGWLKRFKDLLNARVVKGQVEAAFVWDVEVATDIADVSQANMQLPDPFTAGATFIHNKAVTLKPQSSAIKANDSMPDVTALMSTIAVGAQTPKEFLGVMDRGSRSASLTSTEYGTKKYERCQAFIERFIHRYLDRVIINAANAGLIDLDEVLKDARSVRRLSDDSTSDQTRQDVADDLNDLMDQTFKVDSDNQQSAHQAALNGEAPKSKQKPLALTGSTLGESASNFMRTEDRQMNKNQKRRINAIKQGGKFSRELIEVAFPSIAQEDRSAKLKDLALAESMEWIPKEISATMAAKELGITTYEFQDAMKTIIAEAQMGLSLSHVFSQDAKNVPAVVQAESIERERVAMEPPSDQPFTNVPTPPAVKGFKTEPNKGSPSDTPNTGDTKVNNKLAPKQVNPTSPSPGYSKAANMPNTPEGKGNQLRRMGVTKEVSAMKVAIYQQMLKEALSPEMRTTTAVARYILSNPKAVEEYEAAVEAEELNV